MTTKQTIDSGPGEQMACMPVDRSYDVRAKMIIAFNEAKKAGGDLDDALDAAYKSALRYSPNPMSAEQPAPVAVVLPDPKVVSMLVTRAARQADLTAGANYHTAAELAADALLFEIAALNTK